MQREVDAHAGLAREATTASKYSSALFRGLFITAISLAAACAPPDDANDAAGRIADGEPPAAGEAVCLAGAPFVAAGALDVRTAEPGDAHRIGDLRWQAHDGCERLVIDLHDRDGEPADRAGDVRAEVLRDLGVVRVTLRAVPMVATDATDASFDGPLASGAYSVSAPDGRCTYVDVHLGAAAEAYVTTLDEPARVVIDLRPGGPQLPAAAARATRVVVLEPAPGTASYPLRVVGYARTFEANVVARLEHDGTDVAEVFTTATAWVDAWGHFEITLDDGPAGRVVLHVGEHSARDGTWEGVALELDMR